jgi:hypothetical protein
MASGGFEFQQRGHRWRNRGGWETACRFAETLVSAAWAVSHAEIRSSHRGRAAAANARQAAMYLAHVHLGQSLSAVGRSFGRDRTTVAHACACIEDRREDPAFDRVLACLEAALDLWAEQQLRETGAA